MQTSFEIILELVRDGFFVVDSDGSIWRTMIITRWGRRRVGRRRADHVLSIGYRYVSVTLNGKQISVVAHRIVWHVLKGPIPGNREVNHKNGIRHDNRPENLELVTPSENIRHSYRVLGRKAPGSPKFTQEKRAEVIRLRGDGKSYRQIEKLSGVSAAAARAICKKVVLS